MALPQSFQEALSRAETERKLERDTVLQRIGETVQKGVPYLSGVIAGALSKSPIMALGATFVADRLQARFEEKREQRRTKRFEDRQRREAAKIAVREGLFQNEKEALQEIEANRLAEEQENTRKSQQELLQRFGLNREQEEVQQQEKENAEEEENLIQEPTQPTGLALETTLAHVDSEISGIADLLLDRFADEEDRFERAEDRRELEAQLREKIAEGNRQQPPEGTPVREGREEDEDGGGFLGVGARILSGLLPLLPFLAIGGIIIGLGVIFKDEIAKVVNAISELDIVKSLDTWWNGPQGPKKDQQRADEEEAVGDPLSLGETAEEEAARGKPFRFFEITPNNDPSVSGGEFDIIQRDIATPPEGTPRRIITEAETPVDEFSGQVERDVNASQGDRIIISVMIDRIVNRMIEAFDAHMEMIEQKRQGRFDPTSVTSPTAEIGTNMRKVSFDLVSGSKPIVIAPTDASQVVQNTSVSSKKTIQSIGVSPFNMEMRKKFVA